MPTLEEILPKLGKAKVFTTHNAKDGFYQIGLDEESSKKTTKLSGLHLADTDI